MKIINILTTLLVVPMTIDYVSADRYGIWLTLSSMIAWVSYFDFGLGHGFRNKFTESIANNNEILAKQLVSTTYICLGLIFFSILIVLLIANNFLHWAEILNISPKYNSELTIVFAILSICFCTNCVTNTFTTLLIANQQAALASLVQTTSQISGLLGILIVTHCTNPSLIWLAFAYTLIPSLFLIFISLYAFSSTSLKRYRPSYKYFRSSLIKGIIGLGGKFFIIMLSTLVIFQSINLIISRILGPVEVAQYNIAYKYFNVIYMAYVIILTPIWTAFTDAYVKNDTMWMKNMLRKLEKVSIIMVFIIVVMMGCSPIMFKLWLGDSITVPMSTVYMVGLFIMLLNIANTYMYLINGIGKVQLQMIVYIVFALIAIPAMIVLGKYYGIIGILAPTCFACFVQGIIGRTQLKMLINGVAKGLWVK